MSLLLNIFNVSKIIAFEAKFTARSSCGDRHTDSGVLVQQWKQSENSSPSQEITGDPQRRTQRIRIHEDAGRNQDYGKGPGAPSPLFALSLLFSRL